VSERNLRSFVTLARSHGIHVLLASQPLQPSEEYFLRHMSRKPYNKRIGYPLQDEFIKHRHHYNEIIRHVATDQGTWFLDNDAPFAGDERYFIDLVHYTLAGSTSWPRTMRISSSRTASFDESTRHILRPVLGQPAYFADCFALASALLVSA
jgi:hypothetical protein